MGSSLAISSCTSTAACTCSGTPSSPLTWPRRSAGAPTPRSSPSTIGSPPRIPIPRRSTTALPPLITQAGTHGVPLADPTRPAGGAAPADVEVSLDVTPGVPHVFQAYHAILDEAVVALDRAGQLLSAHLTGSRPLEARAV